jgi:hypothetical protein
VNVCAAGGAGLPAERAGGTGTSDEDFLDSESAAVTMPSPALSCAAALVVDDVRSGWLGVGVVGPVLSDLLVMGAAGFSAEALSESPRAGRSINRSIRECELNDEPDVSGESCPVAGGDEVKSGSMSGRLSRADMSWFDELC